MKRARCHAISPGLTPLDRNPALPLEEARRSIGKAGCALENRLGGKVAVGSQGAIPSAPRGGMGRATRIPTPPAFSNSR